MSAAAEGGLLGGLLGIGLVLLLSRAFVVRRPEVATHVLPFVRDLPQLSGTRPPANLAGGPFRAILGPLLRDVAAAVERVLGGAASTRRRLERAGLAMTVHEFRVEQVLWGLTGVTAAGALTVAVSLRSPGRTIPLLVLCAVAFVAGVLLRENRLTAQVTRREREIVEEFPTVAELLALAVGAGEGPVAAIERVHARCDGAMAGELGRVLGEVRTGRPLPGALDDLAARTGVGSVARFAEAMAVAIERGTPLAVVLHAQAADVRESGRRALIETGARREVLMMVPVVFLVLPVTVMFAFWPGVVGLSLTTP